MSNQSPAGQFVRSLVEYRLWWMLPMLVCTLLSISYVLFSSKSYNSRQTLVLRDDLVGTFYKPGRFDSFDSMKSAQETILEIARRPRVIRSALEQLGPTGFASKKNWASDQRIESMQGKIQISAPNGAEFGRTEAIILSVEASTRERSKQFINFMLDEIEINLRELRGNQFDSMQHELEQAMGLASNTFSSSAQNLKEFEKKVGPDLITLISMSESQAGTNVLQNELANLNSEKRLAWSNLLDVKKQIEILEEIENKPASLLEVPQELLQLQPTLASLASGLNDAILKYSQSKGRYQMRHPKVREDFRSVNDIKQRINEKLSQILRSLNFQLELRQGKFDQITKLVDNKKLRMAELSGMRVDHETLKMEVAKNREFSGKAQANLAEIKSLGSAAKEVNLISRIGEPQTDIYASGPTNKIIVFGGMLAGLLIGIGLIMFISPIGGNSLDPVSFGGNEDNYSDTGSLNSRGDQNTTTHSTAGTSAPATASAAAGISAGLSATSDRIRERMEKISNMVGKKKPEADLSIDEQIPNVATAPVTSESSPSSDGVQTTSESFESMVADGDDLQSPSLPAPFEQLTSSELSDTGYGQDTDSVDRNFNEASSTESIIEQLNSTQNEAELSSQSATTDEDSTGPFESVFPDSPATDPEQSNIVGLVKLDPDASGIPSSDDSNVDNESYDPYQRILASLPDTSSSAPALSSNFGSQMPDSTTDTTSTESDRSTQLDSYAKSIVATEPDVTVSQTLPQTVAEKVNQLDQNEQQNDYQFAAALDPINSGAATVAEDLADEPPSDSKQAAGLPLSTSIHHSSEHQEAVGDESVPNIGNEPENRPTASPVDLEMLRRQIAARSEETKDEAPKTLTEVLSNYTAEQDDDEAGKHKVVDKSMADLASSIRDMCKNMDEQIGGGT